MEAIEWKIDIHQDGYSSTVGEFQCDVPGFTLSYKGEVEQRTEPYKTSECSVHFLVEDAASLSLVQDIKNADEQEYSVLIYKGGDLYWLGHFIPDNIEWEDAPFPYQVELSATDYISRLKDIPYAQDSGLLYTGRETLIEHFLNALTKTKLDTFFTSGVDEFLSVALDWWDANHPVRAQATDPAALTNIAHEVFYLQDDNGDDIADNTYNVLKQILLQFNLRLSLGNGLFNIIQINEYVGTTMFTRTYDKEGSALNNYSSDYRKTVDQSTNLRIAIGADTFYEAIQKAKITYNHKAGQNLLSNSTSFDPAESIGTVIGGNGNVLQFTGKIKDKMEGSTAFHRYPIYEMDIVLTNGTTYQLDGSLGTLPKNQPHWSTTVSDVIDIRGFPEYDSEVETFFPLAFTTPEIPQTSIATFRFRFIEFRDNSGSAISLPIGNTHTVEAIDFQLKFLSGGEDQEKEVFEVTNTTDGTTPIEAPTLFEFEDTLTGDGPTGANIGKLRASDGATYVDSTAWGEGTDTRNLNINKLLLQEFVSTQRVPTSILQATIDGDIDFRSRVTYDSVVYMCGGATLAASNDRWEGEWFQVARDTRNLPFTTTEIKDEVEDMVSMGTNTGGSGNTIAQLFQDNENRSITMTSSEIAAGNTTTIQITAIGESGLDVGDEIAIVNPMTFQVDTVTVNALVDPADTEITIVDYNFTDAVPNGAYITFNGEYLARIALEGKGNADVQVKTSDYTMTPQDKHIQIDASGGNVTITLFSASGRNSEVYVSAKDVTNNAIVDGNGAETINGQANFQFALPYESLRLKADGSNWIVE
jgi:hypothetical protein